MNAILSQEVFKAKEDPNVIHVFKPTTIVLNVYNVTGDHKTPKFQYRLDRNTGFPDSQDKSILFGHAETLTEAKNRGLKQFQEKNISDLLNAREINPLFDEEDKVYLDN